MTTSIPPAFGPTGEQILAITAHELRLPISHIMGFVTSLLRVDVNWDEHTRREFLAGIELETNRLAEVVDALLRPHASATRLDPVCPSSIIEGALHRIGEFPADRRLMINVLPDTASVLVAASEMERVLANLIQNAIRYSPPATPIRISAFSTDGQWQLVVDDEGPGVPPEQRQRIFEPFYRGDATVPGHGLGLAICQSIVLAHGGSIEVTDRPGGGARFTVYLPTQDRTYQLEDRRNETATSARGRRRSTNAQAAFQQPQDQRLRCPGGKRWFRGLEAHRGAPIRPTAA